MDDTSEKLIAYEATVRQRVKCEENSFRIVNRLIDGSIEGQFLIECAARLNKDHYKDVVEERAITSLCGYPVCGNDLKNIPKKKYQICTRTNKVYDISDRKNFCSNRCFQASKYFGNQIPESPVWARARTAQAPIELLPLHNFKGIVGDEVVGVSPRKVLEEEVRSLEEQSTSRQSKDQTMQLKTEQQKKNEKNSRWKTSTHKCSEYKEQDNQVKQGENIVDEKNREEYEDNESISVVVAGKDTHSSDVKNDIESSVTGLQRLGISSDESGTDLQAAASCERNNSDSKKISAHESTVFKDSEKKQQEAGDISVNSIGTDLKKLKVNTCWTIDGVKPSQELKHLSDNGCVTLQCSQEVNILPKTKNEVETCTPSQPPESSKMDRLLKLMAQKKGSLAAMVDVQMKAHVKTPTDKTNSLHIDPGNVNHKSKVHIQSPEGNPCAVSSSSNHSSNVKTVKESKSSRKSQAESKGLTPLVYVSSIFKTWITEATINYLNSSSSSSPNSGTMLSRFDDPTFQRGYVNLCQRLKVQEIEMDSALNETEGDASVSDRPGKGLPVYDVLKQEAVEFQLKVSEYITGKPSAGQKKKENDVNETTSFFPTVDKYDQAQIRAKIVMERLEKAMSDLLLPLGLSVQDISTGVREMVSTFKLNKDNIVFRPAGWTLVAFFILKMLGQRDKKIASAFVQESSSCFLSILFSRIGHSSTDIDQLLKKLLESDVIDRTNLPD